MTGADRSLKLGVKLPGETDAPLFAIGPQPPESQADRRPQHLQRLQPAGPLGHDDLDDADAASAWPSDLDFTGATARSFGEPPIVPGRHQLRLDRASSTASSRPTAPRARSRSSTCCSARATTSSTSRHARPGRRRQAHRHGRDHRRRRPAAPDHAPRRSTGSRQGFLVGQPVTISGLAARGRSPASRATDRHVDTFAGGRRSRVDRARAPSPATTSPCRTGPCTIARRRRRRHVTPPAATGPPTASSSASS